MPTRRHRGPHEREEDCRELWLLLAKNSPSRIKTHTLSVITISAVLPAVTVLTIILRITLAITVVTMSV